MEKKSVYRWTYAVETRVVQVSTVSCVIKLVLLPHRLNVPEGHLERKIMRKMTQYWFKWKLDNSSPLETIQITWSGNNLDSHIKYKIERGGMTRKQLSGSPNISYTFKTKKSPSFFFHMRNHSVWLSVGPRITSQKDWGWLPFLAICQTSPKKSSGTQYLRRVHMWWPRWVGWGVGKGGVRGMGYTYTYSWFTSLYSRN